MTAGSGTTRDEPSPKGRSGAIWSRVPHKLRRFGPVTAVTLLSQLVSAAVLVALPQLGRSTADLYSLGIQTGYASIGGVVIGVVYNLALGRPDFRHWKVSAVGAFAFSVVLGAVTLAVLDSTAQAERTSTGEALTILAAFALGGGFLGVSGTFAVRLACSGKPVPLVAATVFPASALLVMVPTTKLFDLPAVVPSLVWLAVCALEVLVFVRLRVPSLAGEAISTDSGGRQLTHALALAVGVITSSILPSVYLTSLAQLPPGTTSITFLVSRIGTAAVGLGVNSLLLAGVNWRTGVPEIRRLPVLLVSAACGSAGIHVILRTTGTGYVVAYVALVIAWLSLLIAGALTIRVANGKRLVAAITWKVAIDLALASAVAVYLLARPSIAGYFAAYMLSQTVTTLVFGVALRRPGLVVASAVGILLTTVIILEG